MTAHQMQDMRAVCQRLREHAQAFPKDQSEHQMRSEADRLFAKLRYRNAGRFSGTRLAATRTELQSWPWESIPFW